MFCKQVLLEVPWTAMIQQFFKVWPNLGGHSGRVPDQGEYVTNRRAQAATPGGAGCHTADEGPGIQSVISSVPLSLPQVSKPRRAPSQATTSEAPGQMSKEMRTATPITEGRPVHPCWPRLTEMTETSVALCDLLIVKSRCGALKKKPRWLIDWTACTDQI